VSKPIDTRTVLLAPGVAMTLCWIPPGRFRMGSRDGRPSEQPVQEVEIPQGFWLGQTPVTQRQYAAFDPEHENHFDGKPEHPAEKVSWHRAVAFCEWLTQRLPTPGWAGGSVGLPSEAQWEYACRAGTETDYHTGDGEVALRRAGWFSGNSKRTTHPVAQCEANGFGLYDMHGNVWEWCRDAWDEHAYRRRAERAPEIGAMEGSASDPARVVRGGAWGGTARVCRAAYRFGIHPGVRNLGLGFRVAVFPGPSCPDKPSGSEGSERAAGRRAGSARAAAHGDTTTIHGCNPTSRAKGGGGMRAQRGDGAGQHAPRYSPVNGQANHPAACEQGVRSGSGRHRDGKANGNQRRQRMNSEGPETMKTPPALAIRIEHDAKNRSGGAASARGGRQDA
jgi:formylglycine-generating enzyme required for sulfatase activity